MKNKEKYREQIENIVFAGSTIAVTKKTGEPTICNGNIRCRECLFCDVVDLGCHEARSAWLNQDADEIDWKMSRLIHWLKFWKRAMQSGVRDILLET